MNHDSCTFINPVPPDAPCGNYTFQNYCQCECYFTHNVRLLKAADGCQSSSYNAPYCQLYSALASCAFNGAVVKCFYEDYYDGQKEMVCQTDTSLPYKNCIAGQWNP